MAWGGTHRKLGWKAYSWSCTLGEADDSLWMAVWAIICDLDHVFKFYGMPNSNSNKPCGICPVDSCHLPWWDFRANAKWIPRIYTKQFWLDAGLQMSCIWDIFGVSCLSFYPDWMHCKPLGIDKILLGSRGIQKSLGCLLKCIRDGVSM